MRRLNYKDEDLCAVCEGACCKFYAGSTLPSDFPLINVTTLADLFRSGNWAVDAWEGDPREGLSIYDQAYFIRPAHTNAFGKIFDLSSGGECVFLTPMGCCLPSIERPSGCRMLKPGVDECIPIGATSRDAAIAWLPYTQVIREAVSDSNTSLTDKKQEVPS